ncbi:MAG TPA: YggS family pyridoxal phosphate-dependent enzyme [Anaerolineae bacterium]|nr:YggS family pyridoxal phosphate-dependent enzyme [Anaerolineae bacterium]
MSALAENLQSVQERVATAARRAGRDPAQVTLVAVTKNQPREAIAAAFDLGLRHFGENRVEEAESKIPGLPGGITWHMIGHVQSRKARQVVPLFQVVHSVDSARLAARLDRLCVEEGERLPILLQVNVSGEESTYGLAAERWAEDCDQRRELLAVVAEIVALPGLQVLGLMTMAPIVADPEQVRPVFASLRHLRDELAGIYPEAGWHHLSMGMSDDFEVAVEEGATLVRVGRAIFDPDQPILCRV